MPVTDFGEGNGTPLQHSCLENPMDRGAWWATVHGVAKSRTWLSEFTFTFHFHALEKEMATRSSVLAWRIPGTEEPDGLPSMGSHRVGHDWSDLAAAARRKEVSQKKRWVHSTLIVSEKERRYIPRKKASALMSISARIIEQIICDSWGKKVNGHQAVVAHVL